MLLSILAEALELSSSLVPGKHGGSLLDEMGYAFFEVVALKADDHFFVATVIDSWSVSNWAL